MARMRHWLAAGLALATVSGAAMACSDSTCDAHWKLASRGGDCANRAILSPGNDTRVNLMLLLRSRSGSGMQNLSYPKGDWDTGDFGKTFFDWDMLRAGLFPAAPEEPENPHSGSRCASLAAAGPSFLTALAAARDVPGAERSALTTARARLEQTCAAGNDAAPADWPAIASPAGQAWLGYLKAADAFYAGRWDEARAGFSALRGTRAPFIAETSAYMLGRVDLNAAIDKSFGEYGFFEGLKSVDKGAVTRASTALDAYLKAWPSGAYAHSAAGLQRRALWLGGDRAGLTRAYAQLLGNTNPAAEVSADLVQEVDNKLLFMDGEAQAMADSGATIIAVQALLALRAYDQYEEPREKAGLAADALSQRRAAFAGQEDLLSYLEASKAYYEAGDMRRVLQLLPDDARAQSYTPLAFSRQVLRGMALAALNDPNEAGFWRELLGGANGLWQRPTVELGLAMHYERKGRIGAVFAPDSVIQDTTIRSILLRHSAGPDILKAEALNRARPMDERRLALFALLDKQLSHGDYAGFLANRTVTLPEAEPDSGVYDRSSLLPAFTGGKWGDIYACPALTATVQTLALSPRDAKARLCLGEFWRLNGFDTSPRFERKIGKDELGGAARQFPGTAMPRGAIYDAVIADPAAAANEKAYALYRSVMCYSPSGNNDCGNADVAVAQRRAWFQRLKRDYPASPFARRLSHYW